MGMKEVEAQRAADRDRLDRVGTDHATRIIGPKGRMLDAREIEKQDPSHHYRFVNVKDPQKAEGRLEEGFRMVPESEGGRNLGGSLALMKIPREKYEARKDQERTLAKDRLSSHKNEMRALAEGISRELRDRHGVKMDPERLLVSE